jgi:hypothetical protein
MIVLSKNIVQIIFIDTELIAKHTKEIMTSMKEKNFISISSKHRLLNKFFEEFLEKQELRLNDAENIKAIREKHELNKATLKTLLKELQSEEIQFVITKK